MYIDSIYTVFLLFQSRLPLYQELAILMLQLDKIQAKNICDQLTKCACC